ncbi:MAG: methyltransferase domain-containing protein [Burkholderiales bacterium]|jgi:precorrin-6B methylase 2|nr:methyltransferase domain-containing protein [Burkholderiales bacterium]
MNRPRALVSSLVAAAALAFAGAGYAQTAPQPAAKGEYKPEVGQPGKDVVWVPTPAELVERMLDMGKVGPNDIVFDLGSGDGRIAIAAAKRGAKTKGIEYNPDMVELSRANARKAGMSEKVEFVRGDIFETDFSSATVVTMYLLPQLNLRLRPTILNMKPGTRIVSHAFTMDDWEADQIASVEGRDAYLWIVPARVAGGWRLTHKSGSGEEVIDLDILQKYQRFTGQAKRGASAAPIADGKLDGDQITFAFTGSDGVKREFAGRVRGDRIEGTTKNQAGTTIPFVASRTK